MYEIDKQPNSDEAFCENCECLVDEKMITETIDGDAGCTECISRCDICFKFHFTQDMYSCPYFGRVCNDCVSDKDYKKDVRDKVIQESLRCYFDETPFKQIEGLIIEVAWQEGYYKFADELKNDKS